MDFHVLSTFTEEFPCFLIAFYFVFFILIKHHSVFFPTVIPYLRKEKLHIRWLCNLTSLLHSSIVSVSAFYVFITSKEIDNIILGYDRRLTLILNFSMAYLLFDMTVLLISGLFVYKSLWKIKTEFIHHLFTFIAEFFCSRAKIYGFLTLLLLITEGTTPCLNLRVFGLYFKKQRVELLASIGLLFGFFFLRILNLLYIGVVYYGELHSILAAPELHFFSFVAFSLVAFLAVLNSFWFSLMLRKAWSILFSNSFKMKQIVKAKEE
eukprot:GCRY01005728.1.p1 GENE.GCRY01005728.1~~GCRY01005728.1.p1  ORF type:complete len:265 (-),score=28.09 GCRY01005728.1:390-1184(-)